MAKNFAELNNVTQKCSFTNNLEEALDLIKDAALIMVDVDGAELEIINSLFSEASNANLDDATIIIETDYNPDGTSNRDSIINELDSYGLNIEKEIKQSIPNRFSNFGKDLSPSFLDQCILGMEGRPLNQSWLIASRTSN